MEYSRTVCTVIIGGGETREKLHGMNFFTTGNSSMATPANETHLSRLTKPDTENTNAYETRGQSWTANTAKRDLAVAKTIVGSTTWKAPAPGIM